MYVIMNRGTQKLYHSINRYSPMIYIEERYAKSSCTKLNALYGNSKQWMIVSYDEWKEKYDPMVPVYNTISGDGKTPIYIRKSQVGGCCDPSTERYHTM